jgi:nicotinamidase-related amidase
MRTALLIVDMQRTLSSGEEAAFGIEAVMARTNASAAKARVAGMPVVLIQVKPAAAVLPR